MLGPTLKTVTLGCKVNQYETEYVRQGLMQIGYRDAARGEPADLCIVNTCTVTAEGDAKSRKAIRSLHRSNPQARIIVMGCYAARAADEAAALPGVAEVLTDKRRLPELLARLGAADPPDGIACFSTRHRAYVKVQDGCRMPCSYCIIPRVRPHLASRPIGAVLAEVRRLVAHGHREIVLTGIHLGHYGADDSGEVQPRLAELLRQVAGLEGEFRVRLSSLDGAEVSDELLDAMAASPRVCPHLHIALQSGADAVLERMQRRWPVRRIVERCRAVRAALDRPALSTDLIVGFPGETDDDFAATCQVVEEVGFSKLHVFRFSPRQGTPAADLPDRVPGEVQHRRAAALAALGQRLRAAYMQSLVGRPLQVLVESPARGRQGWVTGTADRYVPVQLPGDQSLIGQLTTVVPTAAVADRLSQLGETPSIPHRRR
jgi:threonylcarbamoyladenosine tRNA methylthiotransferase MtaB